MDILSMLKSAQSDFNSRQQTVNNGAGATNNSVASFFTQCAATTTPAKPTMPIQIQNKSMTLESIEKNLSKISPPIHDTHNKNNNNNNVLTPSHNPNDLANSPLAQFLNGNSVHVQQESNIKLVNGKTNPPPPGFQPHIVNGNHSSHNGNGNGMKETKLITPAMLQTASIKEIIREEANKKQQLQPEPLNKNQLMQALKYLINNDDEFSKKVHDAYLKSMKSS